MLIIIGLGNPGEQYKNTPHNVGFEALDKFALKNKFPDFQVLKKLEAETSEETMFAKKIILAKPQTFMNNSGKAVKKVFSNNKDKNTEIIIVHDDIDLPFGSLKINKNRGSGGHKGVESIIKELGTENFIRVRIGICPGPENIEDASAFVLKKFTKEKLKMRDKLLNKSVDALDLLVEHGLEKAMNEFNK